jgi:hypothetical protein
LKFGKKFGDALIDTVFKKTHVVVPLAVFIDRDRDLLVIHAKDFTEGDREGWAKVGAHLVTFREWDSLILEGVFDATENPGTRIGQRAIEVK